MRFLLSFLMDPADLPDSELSNKCFDEMMSFVRELTASGQLLFDSQVLSEPPASRITKIDGSLIATEPKTDLILGGFFVITAPSHTDALAIAERCPHSQVGPIEIRALNQTVENAHP
jgi:hypothetical protein